MKLSWDITFSLEKLPIFTETVNLYVFAEEVVFTAVNWPPGYHGFYDQEIAVKIFAITTVDNKIKSFTTVIYRLVTTVYTIKDSSEQ